MNFGSRTCCSLSPCWHAAAAPTYSLGSACARRRRRVRVCSTILQSHVLLAGSTAAKSKWRAWVTGSCTRV